MTNQKYHEHSSRWAPYIGREVSFTLQNDTLFGVLNEPKKGQNYADFLPFWSTEEDGESVRIEKEIPLRVSLSLLEDAAAIIRPYPNGYMERRAKILNEARIKKTLGKIGFSSETN
jgi:hypothetical protein